ncbi:symmetrical bis(5'-nucleosyl)-tetraphosphatase [Cobetia sp. 10Alg 146]|uniref:symmetrical bis(5'-nucleosyl)-tetraphosphatase n=1 Tax=Cobetia sp. 10Alg 146 TaxID=3040019 RepID=UPI002448E13D|nr:symmetrical bis(5'-nucleosyl)-tetraphosphatase [Cobetia sp. 10Alg 146]MDH2292145.1 symmetrical bis(5'-nucleosyl)-tetraphosphatase [Cobetia sp. 10Alg 146]
MTQWAIGDLQGCHVEFERLLQRLEFTPGRDVMWLAGDLVNRGPGSLECLRHAKALGDSARIVLGNHDLHLLAVAHGFGRLKRSDTLQPILDAPDRDELLDWLRRQPLMVEETIDARRTVMTHAGVLPGWTLNQAAALAREAEAALAGNAYREFLGEMYGDTPDLWREDLSGIARLRCIVNVFTRMRFVDREGRMDFASKEGLDSAPEGYRPWFQFPRPEGAWDDSPRLLFGHWAALEGETPAARQDVAALDTGCVWGGGLTALDLETGQRVFEPAVTSRD